MLDVYVLFLYVLAEPLLFFEVPVFLNYVTHPVTQLIVLLTFVLNWLYDLALSL